MRYLHVMSRPKVIDHEHDTVWTEAYVDSAVSTESRKMPLCSSYGCLCSMLTLLCVLPPSPILLTLLERLALVQ